MTDLELSTATNLIDYYKFVLKNGESIIGFLDVIPHGTQATLFYIVQPKEKIAYNTARENGDSEIMQKLARKVESSDVINIQRLDSSNSL